MTQILLLVLFQLDRQSPDSIRGVHAKVMTTSAGRKTGPILPARALARGRQRSFVGSHYAAFFFARAHLIGRDAVFIILDRAFVFAARVVLPRVCSACGEQGCTRDNRGCRRNMDSHR